MNRPVQLLFVEDNAADYQLALRQLRKEFQPFESRLVSSLDQLGAALEVGGWDAVLSDFSMPGTPFPDVLALVQSRAPGLPLLLFSGSIGEDAAVALLRQGVRDFVFKDRPSRLARALQSVLDETRSAQVQQATVSALAASEARYQATFDQAAVGISQVALDGRILTANARYSQILGYPREALPGRLICELSSPEAAARTWASVQRLCAGDGSTFTEEKICFRKDGSAVWISLSVALVRDGQGRPDYLISVVEDIQARKDAEQAREQADLAMRAALDHERKMERELDHLQRMESIGRLAGGVAHDMNNVLAAIMAVANVLELKYPELPDLATHTGIILNAAGRGKKLVQGLMDFSRKEVSDASSAAAVDLNHLVRSEAELLNRTTLQKHVIELDLQEALAPIWGEAAALANALMNLCVNACDAMPDGGTLRLETRMLRSGRVELVVADSGEGMSPEVVARAMEPFFTTKPAGKGTGLGLAIVYGTIKAHGGTLSIDSVPGQGTRMAMVFPALKAAAGANMAPGASSLPATRPLRVLAVDDDELIRETLPLLLATLGHDVQMASAGVEALGLLQSGLATDLLILDLNMPGWGGLETLERVRAIRPELPVLVASGYWEPGVVVTLGRHGQVRCLAKPYQLEELRQALGSWSFGPV